MSNPKILIDAQWRPDHFAAPVSPSFAATPLSNRMVPTIPAVSFMVVAQASTTVFAEEGHPLFLRRSVAVDLSKQTQFHPKEDAGTNPVEGSKQCVHGNIGTISPFPPLGKVPAPPIPGAINCGVIPSDDVKCLNNLEQMIELLANRLYDELVKSPYQFFKNFQQARAASHLAWAQALPGRVADGAVSTLESIWGGIKWVGGKVADGVVAVGTAIVNPVDTYNAAVEAATDMMESIDKYATMAVDGIKVLLDPAKRQAVIDEIKQWLREQLAGLGCAAAEALFEMINSEKPIATQLGELSASIEQGVAEVGAQVAITVLGDKGISKLAMLSKAGKLGGFAGDLTKLMDRISDRIRNPGKRTDPPKPTDPPGDQNPTIPRDRTPDRTTDEAGGSRGRGQNSPCKKVCDGVGNPVNPAFGCKVLADAIDIDFSLPAPAAITLPWQRVYLSDNDHVGWLGQGWTLPFSMHLAKTGSGLNFIDDQGRRVPLPTPRPGEPHYSRFEKLSIAATDNHGYEITITDGGARLRFAPLTISENDPTGKQSAIYVLAGIVDRNDNVIRVVYADPDPTLCEVKALHPEDVSALVLPRGIIDGAGRALRMEFAPLGGKNEPTLKGQTGGMRLVRVVHVRSDDEMREAHLTQDDNSPATTTRERLLVSYGYNGEGDLVEVRDSANALTRVFEYRHHVMVMHAQPGGIVSRYEYDDYSPRGKVIRNWLSDGREWRLDYRPGETVVTTLPIGTVEHYFHDEDNYFVGKTDAMGGHRKHELDAFGKVTKITDAMGRSKQYTLDAKGNITQIIGSDGGITRIEHHAELNRVSRYTYPSGASRSFDYDKRGNLVAETDPAGYVTRYVVDKRGLATTIVDAVGKTKTAEYNRYGLVTRYTDCSGETTRFAYDERGNQTNVIDALGQITRYEYDERDRLVAAHYPGGANERFEQDNLGRLIAHIDPNNVRTEYTVAEDGLPQSEKNALGQTLQYRYDGMRRLQTLINENQSEYQFAYDALDRVISEQSIDGRLTRYRYDKTGLPLAILEQGTQPLGLLRDLQAQKNASAQRGDATFDNPWGDSDDAGFDNQAPSDHYGIRTTFIRDPSGRVEKKLVAGKGEVKRTDFAYDEMGRIVSAKVSEGNVTHFVYDALGRMVKETSNTSGVVREIARAYDAFGNRTQLSLPTGETLNHLYYGSGHLHQINIDGEVVCDIERDQLHRETLRTQGWLTSRYAYDPVGRLKAQARYLRPAPTSQSGATPQRRESFAPSVKPGAWEALGDLPNAGGRDLSNLGPLQQARGFEYDRVGNVMQINDSRTGITTYNYDALGRIQSAHSAGNTTQGIAARIESFTFDPAHNLVSSGTSTPPASPRATAQSSSNPVTTGFVKNNRLEVFEDKRYKYDTHGNLVEKKIGKHTIIVLEWDVEHRLRQATVTRRAHLADPKQRSVQITTYRYDAFGRRISKRSEASQTRYMWDGNRLLGEESDTRRITYLYESESFVPLAQLEHRDTADVGENTAVGAMSSSELNQTDEGDGDELDIRALQQQAFAPVRAAQRLAQLRKEIQLASNDSERTVPLTQALSGQVLKRQLDQSSPNSHGAMTTESQPSRNRKSQSLPQEKRQLAEKANYRILYFHNDQLGTPRELTDQQGNIRWAATYKTWGNIESEFFGDDEHSNEPDTFIDGNTVKRTQRARSATPSSVRAAHAANDATLAHARAQDAIHQPLRFQGQYFDEETGLHYNNFRYYDPDCGRYISQDPIGLNGGTNLYAYVTNPAAWIDPLGLFGVYIFETKNGNSYIGKAVDKQRYYDSTFVRTRLDGSLPAAGGDINKAVSRGAYMDTKSPCATISEEDYAFMVEHTVMVSYGLMTGAKPSLNKIDSPGLKKLAAALKAATCPKVQASLAKDSAALIAAMTAKAPGSGR
jgi:RHS repeat-associated protein